jgi:hypothetical protein
VSGYDVGECRVDLVGTCPACAHHEARVAES